MGGYVQDQQSTFIKLSLEQPKQELRLTILRADGETGGIRMQKGYYPYTLDMRYQYTPVYDLLEVSGPNVTGAAFVLGDWSVNNWSGPSSLSDPYFWGTTDGINYSFSFTAAEAEKYYTDANGTLLITGLPPGQYQVMEFSAPAGVPDLWDSSRSVGVNADQIANAGTLINSKDSFTARFFKTEGDPVADSGAALPLAGGEFIVYRAKKDGTGTKQYLSYLRPPEPGASILPSYTADPLKANVFSALALPTYLRGLILVPGLEPLPADESYYIQEITAPAGYITPLDHPPTAFDQSTVDWGDGESFVFLSNERDPGAVTLQKLSGDPQNLDDNTWAYEVRGAEFALVKLIQPPAGSAGQQLLVQFAVSGGASSADPLQFGPVVDISSLISAGIPTQEQLLQLAQANGAEILTTDALTGSIVLYGLESALPGTPEQDIVSPTRSSR